MDSGRVDFYGRLSVGKDAPFRVAKFADSPRLLLKIGEDFTMFIDDVETITRLIGILEQAKHAFGPDAPETFSRQSPVDWHLQHRAEIENCAREAARVIAA